MSRVAIVTCRRLPGPAPDQAPLLAALRAAGLDVELCPWDDATSDPASFDLCVLRSAWNYPEAPERFEAWLVEAARVSRLANPLDALRWNLHKRYLAALESAGLPVVPTVGLARKSGVDLRDVLRESGWSDVVVKPAISAASYRTRRFRADELEEGRAFLAALLDDRDALVQPYLASVESDGEKSLVWIDGEWTHGVLKRPRFDGEDESVSDALPVSPAELALAERARVVAGPSLLYARADLVPLAPGGPPVLSELELLEPSLFLVQHPPALERLVAGIARRARERTP